MVKGILEKKKGKTKQNLTLVWSVSFKTSSFGWLSLSVVSHEPYPAETRGCVFCCS